MKIDIIYIYTLNIMSEILQFLFGNILFGFSEYMIHSYIHSDPINKNKYDNLTTIHSVHHKTNDSNTFWTIAENIMIIGGNAIYIYYNINYKYIVIGFCMGYIHYSIFHILSHRKSKLIPDYAGNLARIYHHTHHSSIVYKYNFGVTTILYDHIFKTMHKFKITNIGYITGGIPLLSPITFKYGLKYDPVDVF